MTPHERYRPLEPTPKDRPSAVPYLLAAVLLLVGWGSWALGAWEFPHWQMPCPRQDQTPSSESYQP